VRTYVLGDDAVEKQVKHYVLGYDKSDVKGDSTKHPISRLVKISECGSDDSCFGDLSFTWASWKSTDAKFDGSVSANSGRAFVTGGGSSGIKNELVNKRMFADMNGDGKAD